MRKYVNILAAVLVMALLLTGCGGTKEEGAKENVTLRVEIFERGDVPAGAGSITDNAMTKWIQKEFGDPNNITMEFVAVPRTQERQQLNVLMAAGEAPDIVVSYNYDLMYNFYTQGGLTDLTPYMKDAKDLESFLGEEVLDYGKFDGKQILIPSKRVLTGRMAQLIRKDWLDKLGMEVPTTTEEFYQVLKAFKEKDPGNLGNKGIPYGIAMHIPHFEDLVNCFIDYDSMTDAEKACQTVCMMPGYKEGLRFLNKLYNEGLISPDFALDKDRKQVEADFANGLVGFINDDLGRPLQEGGTYETLKKNNPEAELVAVDTFTDAKGNHPKKVYDPVGLYIAVPKTCRNADAAMKYLNWMSQKDVLFTLQFGQEGVNYTLDENGFPVTIDSEESRKTHWYNLGFDIGLVANGKYIDNEEKSIEFNAMATGDNSELFMDCYKNSINDGWKTVLMPPNDAKTKYSTTTNEKYLELIVKSVMATPEAFDSTFDGLLKEFEEIGGSQIQAETIEQYQQLYSN